jgi:hypothetical protein
MDTMTYPSVAMLPRSIAQDHTHFVRQDLELLSLDLSMIKALAAVRTKGTKAISDRAPTDQRQLAGG